MLLNSKEVTAKEAIEGELESQSLPYSVMLYLRGVTNEGDDIEKAIDKILGDEPEIYDRVKSLLQKMSDTFEEQYVEWMGLLCNHKVRIITTDDGKE